MSLRALFNQEALSEKDYLYIKDSLSNWYLCNMEQTKKSSKFAWDGHSTALRAELIAAFYVITDIEKEPWLHRLALMHGQKLSDPNYHQGNWNHGLDQDIGLACLGYALGEDKWICIAKERITKNFMVSVDIEGVSNEQAISYQYYSFYRFSKAISLLEEIGFSFESDLKHRLSLMLEFCLHSLDSEKKWIRLGDTLDVYAKHSTLGLNKFGKNSLFRKYIHDDKSPNCTLNKIYNAGFIFSRTGWEPGNSVYSIRFGNARAVHGHNDHMSFTLDYKGVPSIIDSGFSGYSEMRNHYQRPHAHNVVISLDKKKFNWNAQTDILQSCISSGEESYILADKPYSDIVRKRALLFSKDFSLVVIKDDLTSTYTNSYQSILNIGRHWMLESFYKNKVSFTFDQNKMSIIHAWPIDDLNVVFGNNEVERGIAGFKRYQDLPIHSILAEKRGKNISYLIIICFSDKLDQISLTQQKLAHPIYSRIINLKIGDLTKKIYLKLNGELTFFEE